MERKECTSHTSLSESAATAPPTSTQGGEEWYMEKGFVVFTEVYHLKRGYCCKNACRHCPYGFRKKP